MVSTTTTTTQTPALDASQLLKACNALHKHLHTPNAKKEAPKHVTPLFQEDVTQFGMYASFTLKDMPTKQIKNKPIPIPLKHPFHPVTATSLNGVRVCLFTKDPSDEYKKLLVAKGCDHLVTKVVSVKKLREHYRAFEEKRKLKDDFDVFLTDANIVPMLPKLLGKAFFIAKKCVHVV